MLLRAARPSRSGAGGSSSRRLIRRRRFVRRRTPSVEHRIPGVDERPVQPAGPAGVGMGVAAEPAEGGSDIVGRGIPIDAEQLPRTYGIARAVPTHAHGLHSTIAAVSRTPGPHDGAEEANHAWCLPSNHAWYFSSASLSSQCWTM